MLFDDIQNLTSEPVRNWLDNTRGGLSSAAFGVSGGLKYALCALAKKRFLFVVRDRVSAIAATAELAAATGENVVYLPAKDDVLLYKRIFDRKTHYDRLAALFAARKAYGVVTTPEALLQLMPKHIESFTLEKFGEYSLEDICERLVAMGYDRQEFAYERGSFAIRGDILEIFPINSLNAYKMDFFGDELERIRVVDPDTREIGGEATRVDVACAIDFTVRLSEVEDIKSLLISCARSFKTLRSGSRAKGIAADIMATLERGSLADPSLGFLSPVLSYEKGDILDHFPAEVVYFDEPKLISDYASGVIKEHANRFSSLLEGGEVFDFSINALAGEESLTKLFSRLPCFSFQSVLSPVKFFSPLATIRFRSTVPMKYAGKPDEFIIDVKNWQKSGYKVVIATGGDERQRKTANDLVNCGISAGMRLCDDVAVIPQYFSDGFILHDEKLAFVGTCDLFLSGVKKNRIKKKRNETFVAPEIGDFAVHEDYGIGRLIKTEKIVTTDSIKDCVAIEYAEGDILYIPVEYMDKLTKYVGGSESPQLNKLGNGEFEKIKERVRQSISRMSINLKRLYSERRSLKGFAFSPESDLTRAFGEAFPYELTEDQAQSLAEINADMESPKIMDRLLLGDVGFGKTEVALRAVFKAVLDAKQAAIVAPTTVLVEQHYRTIVARMKDFGVTVGLLDRFRKPSEIKDTIKRLGEGKIDVVVGTHRLFGKDVKFRDLGLLVLDEEQRFGVEHKEKLREMKRNVDTLTMSATPIPRTLNMSLTGIRDISLIMTPPVSRLPVQSYVVGESEAVIRDAVVKELARGGQVFILYNNVEGIYAFADGVRDLVPEARVVVGHGQMSREKLEDSILSFYRGEYDVLVATTIIENGIDIPRANTLIVIDADRLGLFSLYQLKGRVGRSDKMAHAYFTYKEDKILSDAAYKRLNALMENSELGSGYKIAMRDLEIRGAGNVLGREQHGHMDKIGYELYSKLLKEQLGEVTKDFETELDVRIDAFIPEDYVVSSASRLDMYKAIAEIRNADDEKRVVSSAVENYGELPKSVENLILIAKLKNLCKKHEVIKLRVTKNGCVMTFKDLNSFADGSVMKALEAAGGAFTLSFSVNPEVRAETEEALFAAERALYFLELVAGFAN